MNQLVVADRASEWRRLKALVLDSVSSPITRRVYNLGLDEFIAWYTAEQRPAGFTKATVMAWRVALEARGLGPISINVRITAVRKLAVEAADNGLLAPELASGIARIKGVRSHGIRVGNWLSLQQAQALLNTPDVTTRKGLRDRAMFAVLLGCGLRRSELAALTMKHVQQRDGRWCIVDLIGKHGRVRTVPMPAWTKNAIDAWTGCAGISDGHLFRPLNRGDQVCGEQLSEKVVWQMLKPYVATIGVPNVAPHDLRRTTAKLCRAAGGELEQIQMLLGHSSVQTTERYLGTKQDLGTGRIVPLNAIALAALEAHAAWYTRRFGECRPQWYVFPAGKGQPNDPTRPVTTLKTAWAKVRTKANVVGRWRDNRHTLITELAESGAGDEVIMGIAGHVSRAMLSRYSHVRTEAKRRALDGIAARQRQADEKRAIETELLDQTNASAEMLPVQ